MREREIGGLAHDFEHDASVHHQIRHLLRGRHIGCTLSGEGTGHVDEAFAHPWLNGSCREALRRKHEAVGTSDFVARRDECARAFQDAHRACIGKVRVELIEMSPSSRGWWKLSGSLLLKATGQESIPPLKRQDRDWAKNPTEKGEELARVFREKSVLPPLEENDHSSLEPPSGAQMPGW